MQISTFKIGNELYGVDVLFIKEISPIFEIVNVPGAKEEYCGLMNLRGNVVSLIHPGMFTKHFTPLNKKNDNVLIFKNSDLIRPIVEKGLIAAGDLGNDLVGLVINSIGDVLEIDNRKVKAISQNFPQNLLDVISGVVQLDHGLVLIIDAFKFFKKI
ncbi:MAG: hypothetical protein A2504_11140 [Bdellovibrionales bacterium RIFOXYD12_FULL_39_22]|nr:MAG: hypothetical protein A2385_09705 [Bdellovibrionales bacterium RIFOXYB1_FULL_39_21]OFZ44230.1 MAG: hypothetical protein A2485_07325 [Bdellovibrionales bacterium RIFOXYC12_FULL_39_17]OFZ46772.1 MAG: hypothetical protein A2404_04560 [Bdellovibrionales bacterium RIFOXYC1_FULL_39_130]OFZ75951.1 MAG: hypothetical protein A2560_02590 [Bdellovibrionales bacterium RIFOXYD1_FULL_39_84]OFZ95451.1 MAG: hypothetical protein A2504_11140 [Bdellovibrionales bacterium RIFOXYD12_FULL_39_22]HLE09815.1 ch